MATKKGKTKPEPTVQEANYLVTGLTNLNMRLSNLESHFKALATNVLQLTEMVTKDTQLPEVPPNFACPGKPTDC